MWKGRPREVQYNHDDPGDPDDEEDSRAISRYETDPHIEDYARSPPREYLSYEDFFDFDHSDIEKKRAMDFYLFVENQQHRRYVTPSHVSTPPPSSSQISSVDAMEICHRVTRESSPESVSKASEEYTIQFPVQTPSRQQTGEVDCHIFGPKDSQSAIIILYDEFGFDSTPIRLARVLKREGHLVVLPNCLLRWWHWILLPEEDRRTPLRDIKPPERLDRAINDGMMQHLELLCTLLDSVYSAFPNVKRWGYICHARAGRIKVSTNENALSWIVGSTASPVKITVEEAADIRVPFMTEDDYAKWNNETIHQNPHDDLSKAAQKFRDDGVADLKNPDVLKGYEQSYQFASELFVEHLRGHPGPPPDTEKEQKASKKTAKQAATPLNEPSIEAGSVTSSTPSWAQGSLHWSDDASSLTPMEDIQQSPSG